jgi:hypothetical protein
MVCVMILLDSILLFLLSPKYVVQDKMDEENEHSYIQL